MSGRNSGISRTASHFSGEGLFLSLFSFIRGRTISFLFLPFLKLLLPLRAFKEAAQIGKNGSCETFYHAVRYIFGFYVSKDHLEDFEFYDAVLGFDSYKDKTPIATGKSLNVHEDEKVCCNLAEL